MDPTGYVYIWGVSVRIVKHLSNLLHNFDTILTITHLLDSQKYQIIFPRIKKYYFENDLILQKVARTVMMSPKNTIF